MRWIAGLLSGLWTMARTSRVDVGGGLRPGSGASALYLFLFLVFLVVGAIVVLLGVDLGAADRWLDAQSSWIEGLASLALRIVFALVLALCAGAIVTGLLQRLRGGRHQQPTSKRGRSEARPSDARIGWGVIVVALVVGYFAAIGVFGRY